MVLEEVGKELVGFKLHLLITRSGLTLNFPLVPASHSDTALTEQLLIDKARLTMLGDKGYYRASTVLLSGTAGTGKTTLAAHLVDATCSRGETCLYFLFEESPQQMIRNMRSAGIDMQRWVDKGLLKFHADRSNRHGLELAYSLEQGEYQGERTTELTVADVRVPLRPLEAGTIS